MRASAWRRDFSCRWLLRQSWQRVIWWFHKDGRIIVSNRRVFVRDWGGDDWWCQLWHLHTATVSGWVFLWLNLYWQDGTVSRLRWVHNPRKVAKVLNEFSGE